MLFFEKETLCTLLAIFFLTYYFSSEKRKQLYNRFGVFASRPFLEFGNEDNLFGEELEEELEEKLEEKYEDKYLEDIKKLSTEFVFDEKEKELEKRKIEEFFLLEKDEYYKKINEIKDKLGYIERQLAEYSDEDYCNIEKFCENDEKCCANIEKFCENGENGENCENDKKCYEKKNNEIIKELTEESLQLETGLSELYDILETPEVINKLTTITEEKARQFVIDERLDKLKNSFVIEKTPLGNVLMLYNNKRESFEYYSDNTIPYRYLESVCRKYVKMFNCRPIYYIMEEELKKYEKKLEEKENDEKEKKEEKRKQEEENKITVETKKNVFAKFKSYNKEAGTGHVNMAAPPKNSIPNNKVTDTNNEKILLKENANRYSYEGKLSNFNFLKKIDRKVVDKKYAMSFADFKRMQEAKKNE
jgi:hypothetical protein